MQRVLTGVVGIWESGYCRFASVIASGADVPDNCPFRLKLLRAAVRVRAVIGCLQARTDIDRSAPNGPVLPNSRNQYPATTPTKARYCPPRRVTPAFPPCGAVSTTGSALPSACTGEDYGSSTASSWVWGSYPRLTKLCIAFSRPSRKARMLCVKIGSV